MVDDDLGNHIDEIHREHALDWKNKGNEYYKQGRYQEALECFDEALSIIPDYSDALSNKAMALIKLGRIEEAKKCSGITNNIQRSSFSDKQEPTKQISKKILQKSSVAIIIVIIIFAILVVTGLSLTQKPDPIEGYWMLDLLHGVPQDYVSDYLPVYATFMFYSNGSFNSDIPSKRKISSDMTTGDWKKVNENQYIVTLSGPDIHLKPWIFIYNPRTDTITCSHYGNDGYANRINANDLSKITQRLPPYF